MPTLNFALWNQRDIERLMGLTAAMSDLSSASNALGRIPPFVGATLNLEPVILAVLEVNESAPAFLNFHVSTPAPTADFLEVYRRHIVELFRQTKPLGPTEKPAMSGAPLPAGSHQLVYFRSIDARHALFLIVSWKNPEQAPSDILVDTLQLASGQLAEFLAARFSWVSDASILGTPFDRLTDREWVVLQGLQSEDGEKQLADRLELSPHTLHSHIKSIYRKLGVQGRLPVLMMLENAQRTVRMKIASQVIRPG